MVCHTFVKVFLLGIGTQLRSLLSIYLAVLPVYEPFISFRPLCLSVLSFMSRVAETHHVDTAPDPDPGSNFSDTDPDPDSAPVK